jgi:hypothetical protein
VYSDEQNTTPAARRTFRRVPFTMSDKPTPPEHRPADPHRQEYELAPIESISPHPRNPNQGDVAAIRESIDVNGFYGACIVQKSTRFILAGEHRWRAEKEREQTHVPVLFVDVDDETALRILLADNGTRRGARTTRSCPRTGIGRFRRSGTGASSAARRRSSCGSGRGRCPCMTQS